MMMMMMMWAGFIWLRTETINGTIKMR